jgi:hypothetical protein
MPIIGVAVSQVPSAIAFDLLRLSIAPVAASLLVHRRLDNTYVSLASKDDSDVIRVCDNSWASRASYWPVFVQIFVKLAE